MCGRFALFAAGDELARRFQLAQTPLLDARYNIAPSDGRLFAFAGLWERWRDPQGQLRFVIWGWRVVSTAGVL